MRFTKFLEFLSISFSARLQLLKLISWGPIYSCEVVTMPKDHGRRLWCDNGTCPRLSEHLRAAKSLPLTPTDIHWLHLNSSPLISLNSIPFNSIILAWVFGCCEYLWMAMHMLAQCLPGVAKSGTDVPETGTSCSQREVLDKKVLPDNLSLHFTTNHMSMRQKALLLSRHVRLWNITNVSFRIKLVFGKAPHPHRHHPRRFPKGVAHALSWPARPAVSALFATEIPKQGDKEYD